MANTYKKEEVFYTAIYLRISREDGDKDESDSIETQRKMLMSFVKEQDNFMFISEYVDDGFSGTTFDRPAFNRMIEDINQNNINCIVVKDLSRFGRNYIDTGFYLERFFIDKNIRFISLNDSIDSFEKEYDMLMPVRNIFNAQYARDISLKVQSAFKTKQKNGEFVGAFPSYGYIKSPVDRHKLLVDEYPANIVRRIFSMYCLGHGKISIAHILNEEGVLCPTEYKKACGYNYSNANKIETTTYWSYSTVNKILHNEMYVGNMVQGKTKRRMKAKPTILETDKWIRVENTHPPIITLDVWENTQKLLQRNTTSINFQNNNSIFSGFLKCADCGRSMSKKIEKSTKKISFRCSTYVRYGKKYCSPHTLPAQDLERIILNDLNTIIGSIENLKEIAEQTQISVPTKKIVLEKELDSINNEIEKIKKLKKDIYIDFKEGLINRDEFIDYKKDYDKKETLLEQKRAQYENTLSENNESEQLLESQWVKNLLKLKKVSSLDRKIIVDMIDMIYISADNKIKIVYKFSDELKYLLDSKTPME